MPLIKGFPNASALGLINQHPENELARLTAHTAVRVHRPIHQLAGRAKIPRKMQSIFQLVRNRKSLLQSVSQSTDRRMIRPATSALWTFVPRLVCGRMDTLLCAEEVYSSEMTMPRDSKYFHSHAIASFVRISESGPIMRARENFFLLVFMYLRLVYGCLFISDLGRLRVTPGD